MATAIDVTVKATLKYTDGSAATLVGIKAIRQQDPVLAATMNTADIITATSHSSTGVVTLTLKGYDLLPVVYKIVFSDGQYMYLNLPKNAKACNLGIVSVTKGAVLTRKNITGLYTPTFEGATFAVVGSAQTIAPTCNVHKIGCAAAASVATITATDYPIGQLLTLVNTGADTLTFTDSTTLKLAGDFASDAGDSLTVVTDGTAWYEVARSAN